MGLTGMKYRLSACFCRKETFFDETKTSQPLWLLSRNLIFFKPHKNLCTTPKYLTKIEYGPHGNEIGISCQFSSGTDVFC
jgi:hypothetical protein